MAGLFNRFKIFQGGDADQSIGAADWIQLAPNPLALIDADGKVIGCNSAWKQNAGLAGISYVNGDDLRLGDGHWVRPTLATLPPGSGAFRLCSIVDISDLKSDTARDQPDYFRRMLDVFEDCVKVVDPSGRLLFLNTAGRKVLGVAPDAPLGMRWIDLVPPGSAAKLKQILDQVLSGEAAQFSNHSQFPGGEAQTWDHVLTPYRDHTGQVIAALCVSRNVTDRHGNQEATRLNEERLAKAAKAAGMGVWDIDLRSGRVHCDDLWYEVTGIPRSAAITSMAQFMTFVHAGDVDRIRASWQTRESAFDHKGEYRMAFRMVGGDGNVRGVQATAAIIRDLAGVPVRAVAFVRQDEACN